MRKRVIDTHNDTLMAYCKDYAGFVGGNWDVTLDQMQTYDTYLGTFAMYHDATVTQEQRIEQAALFRMAYLHMISKRPVKPIRTVGELESFEQEGGCGVLLSIENACFFEDDFADIKTWWDLGVRMISFTHFANSQYGCGNRVNDTPDEDTGLTERGKVMAQLAELIGMIVDVSHLSFKSFWDVASVTKKPFIASHSNSHAIRSHGRNFTDDMFKVIVERGGLTGMCSCPPFVTDTSDDKKATLSQMADHIDHLCGIGGQDVICMGGDLDGIGGNYVVGLEGCAATWNLAEELLRRNYSEALVEKIMWGNAYEFLRKMLPK